MTISFAPLMAETRAELLKAARQPQFVIPTLAFPLVFYSIFGVMMASDNAAVSSYMLATFGIFAAMGPSIFGVGFGISTEKDQGWLELKRITPLPSWVPIVAKLIMAVLFTGLVLILLYVLAAFAAGVRLTHTSWLMLAGLHLSSAVPFCLLGLAIGLRFSSQVAAAVMNLCFFGFAILGGLWMPLSIFPDIFQQIALAIPSFHFAGLARAVVGQTSGVSLWLHALALILSSAVFAVLSVQAWQHSRKD